MSDRAGVLFDVDGTLVDTTYLHAVCWHEALRQAGHQVPAATVHRAIGMGSDKLLDHLLGGRRDSAQDEALNAAHSTLYRQHCGRLQPLPGAKALLHWCVEQDLRVVLASSASDDELSVLRAALDADDLIFAATSASDASSSKPAPDIVDVALERAGLHPGRAVFVGDAVWDGQAAGRAGLRFVALTCGGTGAAELVESGAIEVWRDPADLLAHAGDGVLAEL